ncbi:MAG: tRNA dihydrouridine synthase DusB [Bacillota bacterium]|nr:tRNA dihydrouridine synthase DusB [Bacillota bacterium]
MQIGTVQLTTNVFNAPMAGVTDKAYRLLAKDQGCELTFTEMVSDKALIFNNKRTFHLINLEGEIRPIAVQIFGSEPEVMAEAAKIVENIGADIIDINMGCPAPKIVKNGEGCALMRNLPLAEKIIKAVVAAVKIPVTVKMRKGWDESEINVLELAERAEAAGAVAVTVHGRTRKQFYSGQADWTIIAEVKRLLRIPVIGNGDVWTPQDGKALLEQTGCDAIMIGRGSMGNPWIFGRTNHLLKTGELLPEPTALEKVTMALKHLRLIIEDKGEVIGVREMRKHAAWYLKGLPGASKIRDLVNKKDSQEELEELLIDYLKQFD